jgi:hypothetical protein
MYRIIFILLYLNLFYTSFAQGWSTPVNVSNRGINCMDPHMTVDHNGVIHAVWASTYPMPQYPRTLILYAKSSDQGNTWSTPEILIDDTNSWIVETHIVCNSQNHLYVSYDHNVQVAEIATVNLIFNNGSSWSEPSIVSDQPGSFKNRLVIDQTDRVYCFWDGWDNGNDNIFYRYFENGTWSEVIKPYNGNGDYHFLNNITVDNLNNLHGVGYYSNTGYYYNNFDDVYYYYYNKSTNQWAPKEKIDNSPGRAWYGCDVCVDTMNIPHFIWGEFFPLSDTIQNYTSYLYPNESGWLPVDTVEKNHNSRNHQILLDSLGNYQLIVMQEINNQRTKLVQYINIGAEWVEYIIDSSNFAMFYPDIESISSTTVAIIYFKGGRVENDTIRDIFYSKYDLYTDIEPSKLPVNVLTISPNPFSIQTEIKYNLQSDTRVQLEIFDLSGKLIERLIDQTQSPGRYCHTWQCTGLNRKEVKAGVYIVRLQAGRYVYSRKVVKL